MEDNQNSLMRPNRPRRRQEEEKKSSGPNRNNRRLFPEDTHGTQGGAIAERNRRLREAQREFTNQINALR